MFVRNQSLLKFGVRTQAKFVNSCLANVKQLTLRLMGLDRTRTGTENVTMHALLLFTGRWREESARRTGANGRRQAKLTIVKTGRAGRAGARPCLRQVSVDVSFCPMKRLTPTGAQRFALILAHPWFEDLSGRPLGGDFIGRLEVSDAQARQICSAHRCRFNLLRTHNRDAENIRLQE